MATFETNTDIPTWLVEQPIAHRGLHDARCPENSLAAFQQAVTARWAIELDVQLLADAMPAVFHDVSLMRMTGWGGTLAQCRRHQLAKMHLNHTHETIPTLDQVLEVVQGQVPLLVEIKNDGYPGLLEQGVATRLRRYTGPVAIQSFNPMTLAWFRLFAPEFPRGQLASSFTDEPRRPVIHPLCRRLVFHPLTKPDFIGYCIDDLPYWPVTQWRMRGGITLAWTIRTQTQCGRAQDWVDNIIFEGLGAEDLLHYQAGRKKRILEYRGLKVTPSSV